MSMLERNDQPNDAAPARRLEIFHRGWAPARLDG